MKKYPSAFLAYLLMTSVVYAGGPFKGSNGEALLGGLFGIAAGGALIFALLIFGFLLHLAAIIMASINLYRKKKGLMIASLIVAAPTFLVNLFLALKYPTIFTLFLLMVSVVIAVMIYRGSPRFQNRIS
jgi:hypothetical protein